MACSAIAKGRVLGCKDSRIGIKYFDIIPFSELGFTVAAQEIATLPVGLTEVFRYEVKGTGNKWDDVPTVNAENRTTEFKQTLNLVLPKLGKETEVELMALLYGRSIVFAHDYNGNVKVFGIDSGLDATTAPASSDTSGYAITLEGSDSKYAPFLSSAAKTALAALVSTDIITP